MSKTTDKVIELMEKYDLEDLEHDCGYETGNEDGCTHPIHLLEDYDE